MFNLFPKKKSVDVILEEINNLYPTWTWTSSIKDADGKDVSVADLISKYNELLKENKNLNHLKEENVRLMEKLQKNTEKNIPWIEAKLQIVQNDYKKCAEERDEYKHQLNAANKENEKLKKDIVDYVFEKDDEIEKLKKELNHMKAVAEGAISLCDLSDKTDYNAQKHPMYPIHWGGYEPEKWSTTKVAVDDAVQAKLREIYGIETDSINIGEPFVESELEKRVKKLERKVEELRSIKTCQK